jgi:peptidoglycan/xylan/chitin deacetylase (PgdA/CDA1 family)
MQILIMLAGVQPALRMLVAKTVSSSRSYLPCQWAAGQLYGGFVLAFHNLPPQRFRDLICALRPNEPVHLSVIVDRLNAGKPTNGLFAITVDDGVGDTVRTIAAVAVERHWPVTFFLPTGYLDTPGGMPFQWLRNLEQHLPHQRLEIAGEAVDFSNPVSCELFEQRMNRVRDAGPPEEYVRFVRALVERAVKSGWVSRDEIAPPAPIPWAEVAGLSAHAEIRFESHGVTHTAVSALSRDQLETELRVSRHRISLHTNQSCRHFCYPFGGPRSIGGDSPRTVARYYDSAVTMSRGRVRERNLFLLPRIPLYAEDTTALARLKVLTR